MSHLERITSLLLGRIIAQTALGHLNLYVPILLQQKHPVYLPRFVEQGIWHLDNNKSLLVLHFLLKLLLNTQAVRLFID